MPCIKKIGCIWLILGFNIPLISLMKTAMRNKLKTSLLIAAGVIAFGYPSQAQHQDFLITNNKGSVYANLKGRDVKAGNIAAQLPAWLGLSADNSFREVSTTTDKLGFSHTRFQQYYKNVLVDDGDLLVHVRNGMVTSMNGRVAPIAKLSVTNTISADEAVSAARRHLEIVRIIRQHPETLLITSVPAAEGAQYALAYKVRVDGRTLYGKVKMAHVYIDAQRGTVIKSESLIAHADVEGTAHTLYSGVRTIITDDSEPEAYRLRDSARNIETYDVTGDPMSGNSGLMFDEPKDYYNETTAWTEQPALMAIQLNESNPALLSGLGFQTGKFIASMVVRDGVMDLENGDMVAWPDLMLNQIPVAQLPLKTGNLYAFPRAGDTVFMGGFGKVDVSGDELAYTDTSFFSITHLHTPGVYPWNSTTGGSGIYEIAMAKNPALDAHWGMGETHDYYMEKFDRNSYDGNGSVVKNYINGVFPIMVTQNNAAALPEPDNAMVYGLGDGILMNPVVGLDVMGHEFTHMVTANNGNDGLQYRGESGALNESFSDIFGTCIEFRSKGTAANWLIGEDVILAQPGFFRSMSDPKAAAAAGNPNFPPQPDTYGKQYWVNPTNMQNDNGGVHTNSGVQNKWFYLLSEGGAGTNDNDYDYNVAAIGMEKAEQIAYRNLITYLVPTSKYVDACNGSIQAAIDLFGEDSEELESVKEAWRAVGLLEGGSAVSELTESLAAAFMVYPNPSTDGQFTIASEHHELVNAQLFNIVGKPVLQLAVKKGINSFSASELPKGLYLLKFVVGRHEVVQKISLL